MSLAYVRILISGSDWYGLGNWGSIPIMADFVVSDAMFKPILEATTELSIQMS